jgi:hypothetical protein
MRGWTARTSDQETTEHDSTSRRGFLRKAGITGAAAVGMIGLADMIGLSPAHASTSTKASSQKTVQRFTFTDEGLRLVGADVSPECCSCGNFFQCQCGGCCPSGTCCYHVSGCCGTFHVCLPPGNGCPGRVACVCC